MGDELQKERYQRRPLIEPYWEQQPEETDNAFAAFVAYRDMPPRERSMLAVSHKLEVAWGTVKQYAHRWQWTERATAYGRHLDRINLAEQEAAVREMARRQATAAQRFASALLVPAEHFMKRLEADEAFAAKVGEDLDAASATKVLKLLARIGSPLVGVMKLERLARGAPTENVRTETVDGFSGYATNAALSRLMSDPESRDLLQKLAERSVAFGDEGDAATDADNAGGEQDPPNDAP